MEDLAKTLNIHTRVNTSGIDKSTCSTVFASRFVLVKMSVRPCLQKVQSLPSDVTISQKFVHLMVYKSFIEHVLIINTDTIVHITVTFLPELALMSLQYQN